MKFDMHCHTFEGSLDGKIRIEDYIGILKKRGFGGMLVTDHNTYNGYREWVDSVKGKKHKDFVVLKGIEYDTLDAGHILVILPETEKLLLMELRGLPVHLLADMVHRHGGILGPAHPFGEPYLSFMTTVRKKKRTALLSCFDFIEVFNSCQSKESNEKAKRLAYILEKPGFGGSDAHRENCIGKGFTELPDTIRKESDLIRYVHEVKHIKCGGSYYTKTVKGKIGRLNDLLVYSFFFYNRFCAIVKGKRRKAETRRLTILKNREHLRQIEHQKKK